MSEATTAEPTEPMPPESIDARDITPEEIAAIQEATEGRIALGEALEALDATGDAVEISEASDNLSERAHKRRPPSPTALELDEWSLRRGREVFDESERLKQIFDLEAIGAQDVNTKIEDEWHKAQLATADFHSAAFEPEPAFAEECQNERISRYMKQLFETPEFQALHRETQLDDMASEIAAASFAEQWVALCKTEEPEGEFQKDMQCLAAAGAALNVAKDEIGGFRDAQSALGIGTGKNKVRLSSKQLAEMFKRVRGSQALKRICDLAGRYRRFAQAQQRKKVLHGQDDVVGVVLDGDPGRILPHELASLDDPDLELDVLRRLVERQVMSREFRGVEHKARGPIVVVVDESGSMSGEPLYTAKAMALALAWVARNQNRYCCLVSFSDGPEGAYCVCPTKGQSRFVDAADGVDPQIAQWKAGDDALMEWLEHDYSGGTSIDVPLVELPRLWSKIGAPAGKTDIILISDAQLNVPPQIRDRFLQWKHEQQVKMISMIIGYEPGDLAAVSDRTHKVKSLGLCEEAVAEALSV